MSFAEAAPPTRDARLAVLAIYGLYAVSYGLLLLNVDGIYWDDWTIYGVPTDAMLVQYRQGGNIGVLGGYVNQLLLALGNGVLPYRVAVFAAHAVAGLGFYAALRTITELSDAVRAWLLAIFLMFPVNEARVALTMLPFNLCYAAFFVALWGYVRHFETGHVAYRVFGALCLVLSYPTMSHVPFTGVILLYVAYRERRPLRVGSALGMLRRWPELFVLPLAFAALRPVLIPTFALYAGYNHVSPRGLLMGVPTMLLGLRSAFYDELRSSLQLHPVAVALAALVAVLMPRLGRTRVAPSLAFAGVATALLVFLLAVFPYAVVGKIPQGNGWLSRWEMLVPTGAAGLLVFSALFVADRGRVAQALTHGVLSWLLASFVVTNVETWLDVQRDWYKQEALLSAFASNPKARDQALFLVEDHSAGLNALHRSYRFYEYSGMLDSLFGGQARLMADKASYRGDAHYTQFAGYGMYRIANYARSSRSYRVRIDRGRVPSRGETFALLVQRLWQGRAQVARRVADLVRVRIDAVPRG